MSRCKEDVIEMIDKAAGANYARGICECLFLSDPNGKCPYCKIKEALQMARSCIIASVDRVAIIEGNMREIQKEIEMKLKTLMEMDRG